MPPPVLICDYLTPDRYTGLCRASGLGIELQQFYDPQFEPSVDRLLTELKGITLRALHAPFFDLSPGSFDSAIRDVTARRFRSAIGFANRCQCEHVVFHNAFYPQLHLLDGWLDRAVDFWKRLLDDCPGNVTCYVENTLEFEPALMGELCSRVGDSRLRINLDVGHAHAFSKVSPLQWVSELGGLIGYVHLHSNDGTSDQHLGLAGGTAPIEEVCRALLEASPGAVWAIEARGEEAVHESLRWLHERGFMGATATPLALD